MIDLFGHNKRYPNNRWVYDGLSHKCYVTVSHLWEASYLQRNKRL